MLLTAPWRNDPQVVDQVWGKTGYVCVHKVEQ